MKKSIIALLAVVGIFALSSNSHAVPAFARANGMECSTCHFQQFPLLNAFGRDFKANGYTRRQGQVLLFDVSRHPHIRNPSFFFLSPLWGIHTRKA